MKIIFTAIFGNYDRLQPIQVPTGWRAIVFSDVDISVKGWRGVRVEAEHKIFRKIKICPHLYLPLGWEKCLWVDGNILPRVDVERWSRGKSGFWIMKHPHRDRLSEEASRCIELGKDKAEIINPQVERYLSEGYPDDFGMVGSGVMLRDAGYDDFNEAWWQEVRTGSVRDQISFNYTAWKHGLRFKMFPFLEDFKRVPHNAVRA